MSFCDQSSYHGSHDMVLRGRFAVNSCVLFALALIVLPRRPEARGTGRLVIWRVKSSQRCLPQTKGSLVFYAQLHTYVAMMAKA